jgi:hypothetical protein
MRREADALGAALFVGEWGAKPEAPSFAYFRGVQQAADAPPVGHAFWVWKECSEGRWGFFDFDEACRPVAERADGERAVSLPHVSAAPGRLDAHAFDPDTRVLQARFTAQGGEGPLELRLPATWYPQGAHVWLDGREVASGAGVVDVAAGAGAHAVEVRP